MQEQQTTEPISERLNARSLSTRSYPTILAPLTYLALYIPPLLGQKLSIYLNVLPSFVEKWGVQESIVDDIGLTPSLSLSDPTVGVYGKSRVRLRHVNLEFPSTWELFFSSETRSLFYFDFSTKKKFMSREFDSIPAHLQCHFNFKKMLIE